MTHQMASRLLLELMALERETQMIEKIAKLSPADRDRDLEKLIKEKVKRAK